MRGSVKFFIALAITLIGWGILHLIQTWSSMNSPKQELVIAGITIISVIYITITVAMVAEGELHQGYSPIHWIRFIWIKLIKILDIVFD